MELFIKTLSGEYGSHPVSVDDCVHFFKTHTDSQGNVTADCMICKDAGLRVNTDTSISWVMSDENIDRDFERFDSSGWDLAEFKKNPVVQWSHDYTIPAIGRVISPHVRSGQLIGKVEFDQEDELAVSIDRKVRSGYIRAGSVGFFPIQVEIPEDEGKSEVKLIYRKQELREFSICNVPANPNALADGKSKADTETPYFEHLFNGDYDEYENDEKETEEVWMERVRATLSGQGRPAASGHDEQVIRDFLAYQKSKGTKNRPRVPVAACDSGFKTMFKK